MWLVVRPYPCIPVSRGCFLRCTFYRRGCFNTLPRRTVLLCLIHMSAQSSIDPYNTNINLALSFIHNHFLHPLREKYWPSAMRIPRPSLIPRLLLLAIIATVAAAVPLLFWSRRYALISGSEEKVHSSSSKAKDCLKRESLALHSHSALFSVSARHVGCASWSVITCNCGSQREMQCLQRRFLLRQPLLLRAAEHGRHLCASWWVRVLSGIACG